ncbi:hypothetical protein MHYP_G00110920 [Metynnis hypsauchen]
MENVSSVLGLETKRASCSSGELENLAWFCVRGLERGVELIRLSSSVPECGHCACPRAARWRCRSWAFPSVGATPCSRASGRTEPLGGGLKQGKTLSGLFLAASSSPPGHMRAQPRLSSPPRPLRGRFSCISANDASPPRGSPATRSLIRLASTLPPPPPRG